MLEKVIAALEEQKTMAEAKIAGQIYAPTHMVWQEDDARQRVQVEKPQRDRQGWFKDVDAKTFFALHYAGKSIEALSSPHARLLHAGLHDRVPTPIGEWVDKGL